MTLSHISRHLHGLFAFYGIDSHYSFVRLGFRKRRYCPNPARAKHTSSLLKSGRWFSNHRPHFSNSAFKNTDSADASAQHPAGYRYEFHQIGSAPRIPFLCQRNGVSRRDTESLGHRDILLPGIRSRGIAALLIRRLPNELSIIQGGKSRLPSGDGMVIIVA